MARCRNRAMAPYHLTRFGQQRPSRRREDHGPAGPVERGDAQPAFQHAELPAQGGLGHEEPFRRASDALSDRHRRRRHGVARRSHARQASGLGPPEQPLSAGAWVVRLLPLLLVPLAVLLWRRRRLNTARSVSPLRRAAVGRSRRR